MVIEVFEDLMGGDIKICHETMLELGVVLFVEGIAKVVNDALEETLTNKPGGLDELLFFFLPFLLVSEHGVSDGGVI